MHALLRPPGRGNGAGLRQGLPDQVDPVRPAGRAPRTGPGPGGRPARAGRPEARLYLEGTDNGIGGAGAFFLLLDEPEVYGLPPDPVVSTRALPDMWKHAGLAAAGLGVAALAAFAGRRR